MNKVFIGPYGLRAGWRVLLFLLTAVLLSSVPGLLLRSGPARMLSRDVQRLCETAFGAITVIGATWALSRMDGRPVTAYGLGPVNRWRNLAAGAAAGFAALSVLMGMLRISGGYSFAAGDIAGAAVWKWGAYWAVFFLAVGLMEEGLTRGYPLFAMAQGMGYWPSAILLSLFFGLGHLGNPGEQAAGIVNAVFAGLAFAYSVRWTGTLWWAIGSHMSWDWAETFFYGVADSGASLPHHFLSGVPGGPAWLSGGTVGPEGSVLAAPALLLLAALARFTAPEFREPGLERRPRPVAPEPVPVTELPPPAEPGTEV